MDPVLLIILIIVGILGWSGISHRLKFRFTRFITIILAVLLILVVAAAFFDFSDIFGGKNILARTGAAIVADVKEVWEEGPIIKKETLDSITEDVSDKTKETTKGILNLPTTKSVRRMAD